MRMYGSANMAWIVLRHSFIHEADKNMICSTYSYFEVNNEKNVLHVLTYMRTYTTCWVYL